MFLNLLTICLVSLMFLMLKGLLGSTLTMIQENKLLTKHSKTEMYKLFN